jgi:uncharacterized protein
MATTKNLPTGKASSEALQFNVAQLLKQQGPGTRSYTITDAVIPGLDDELILGRPINGQVKFHKTGHEIVVMGTFETGLIVPCTRCLTEVEVPITFEIEETFTPTIDIATGLQLPRHVDVDEATLIDEQHILDLTEVIRQSLYLNQPSHILCNAECLGLCPHCGINRNEEACDCEEEQVDVRWSGLQTLKDRFN